MSQAQPASSMAGSLRIFHVFGISVYVHWSWALVAFLALRYRTNLYQAPYWNVIEYVSLFAIVLLHEFGHSLACRQVGGRADSIVLWPLGGIAFVQPPARPGAWLWSIVAGPLVNFVLIPVTIGLYIASERAGWPEDQPDAHRYVQTLMEMNLGLFIFNMLPIYPLDGGQILQSILWFFMGRALSLKIASGIGLVASVAAVGLALWFMEIWLGIVAAFAATRCWAGIRQAQFLAFLEQAPRHQDAKCPACAASPPAGAFWYCPYCSINFDAFVSMGACPRCGTRFPDTQCLECFQSSPIMQWYRQDSTAIEPDSRW